MMAVHTMAALAVCVLCLLLNGVTGSSWVEVSGRCYRLGHTQGTLTQARTDCGDMGAALVELDSPGEMAAVRYLLTDGHLQAWVDMTKDSGGVFRWTTGGGTAETDWWAEDEPNDSGQCVRLVRFYPIYDQPDKDLGQFYLADHRCDSLYTPFCEKPASRSLSRSVVVTALPGGLCPLQTISASSRVHCALLCTGHTACLFYRYPAPGHCALYRLMEACPEGFVSASPGDRFYRLTRDCT